MPAEVSKAYLASKPDARSSMISVIDSLRSVVQAQRASSRDAEQKLGISSAQIQILQELNDSPAMSINDLAERTFTHQSSVSTVVSKLVKSRLVTRRAARHDARKLSVSITAAGKALLRKAPDAAQASLVAALRTMHHSELRALAGLLGNLTARISEQELLMRPRPKLKVSLRA
ncbi:MAG TPA: MarR family winged helix-turn-helix transcriptional regulator [Gemmatimonadaceae bacterium]|nr:MarR family winged helix-turn-helix transcriptional regulator [Gemmatimonadaceae bacterium]